VARSRQRRDDDQIADEMHKITKGTDFGWPYTYYVRREEIRLSRRVRWGREEAGRAGHVFHRRS
jgi:glucose/arabinose dehydrogenase